MSFSFRRLGVVAVVCFAALRAHATQVALVADAHVNATRTSTNFGSLANLYVGNGNTALLQFDLTSLPAGITSAGISRATLTLFVNRVNASGPVTITPATSAWTEGAVTFATQPSPGAAFASFTPLQAGQYVTVDITALVQAWVAAPSANDGLILTSSMANILLDSKENDQTAHPAALDITVTNTGATGATGAAGAQGLQGATGAQGSQGIQGIAGVAGPTGMQGIQGATGLQGITGATGINGTTGATGIAGTTGAAGITGSTGITGATGIAGVTGAQGATGSAGVTGATGIAGTTGATGVQGVTGATGNTVGGNYNVATTYFPGSVVVYGGQNYLGLNANNGIIPGTDPAVWSLISGSGAQGATGVTGSTGPQGSIGLQGTTGATGAQGATGAAGSTGATGMAGTTGVTGATGVAGSTGYTGSTGSTGATGIAGATGVTGATGIAGSTGYTGSTGSTGATGTTGATGIAGATGSAGNTGSTGITYMGAYSNSTTYSATKVVLYNNTLYYDTFAGITPTGTPPTNTTYWTLLLPQGATGSTGAAGNDGAAGPTGATGPGGTAGGNGGSPSAIPLSFAGHSGTTTWNSPTSSAQQSTLNAQVTTIIPSGSGCVPSMTVYSYASSAITWTLFSVMPSTSSATWSVGSPLLTCSTPAGGGQCSATYGGNLAPGTIITLAPSTQAAPAGGGFLNAFSCN